MELPVELQPGAVLEDRYQVVSKIGIGGMSTVYLVDDLKLPGKQWAVKQTFHHLLDKDQWAEEARLLTRLQHPLLPQIIEFFTAEESPKLSYLVMDYIHGPTLAAKFATLGNKMDNLMVVDIASQICVVLDYLHHVHPQPIIYRDLKPSNIMFDDVGHVRLIDFGTARSFKQSVSADTVQIGTIGFAAPEQFCQTQTDPRTDLYALGAMMYYLLTNGTYYYMSRRPIEQVCPDLPKALTTMVTKLLQVEPLDRYQSARELYQEFTVLKMRLTEMELLQPNHKLQLSPLFNTIQNSKQSSSTAAFPTIGHRKLIVIGGLYAGVGTTFVTFALARLFGAVHIPHAVVEYPLNEPDHFTLLAGERHIPSDYPFLTERITQGFTIEPDQEWVDKGTIWYPANPKRQQTTWSQEYMFKLFYRIKSPIILLDISHRWADPIVREVCSSADTRICVAGASLGMMNRPSTIARAELLQSLMTEGKGVDWIGNRPPIHKGQCDEWMQALPANPQAILPEFNYEKLIHSIWRGQLPHDDNEVREQLNAALSSYVQRLLPESHQQHTKKRKRWSFPTWLKR